MTEQRAAGVLMHISSLPGRFGIGNLGPEAYRFVDFLVKTKHKYWQILPLNPLSEDLSWSPYSPVSAFAGNSLFISPDILADEKLIVKSDFIKWEKKAGRKINYKEASAMYKELTIQAWNNFKIQAKLSESDNFKDFCKQESFWLHDYALFVLFKELFAGRPWNKWPDDIKMRKKNILKEYSSKYKERLDLEKFRQFLFHRQWMALKKYANINGIKIIGDLPIYVGYDNADVWSNPHLFKLNSDRSLYAIAGVPPDYFSETGQLWNMPVYDWKAVKKEKFKWWLKRIAKNLELTNFLRLDHFRGFVDYWEVRAEEKTAVNGSWVKGPGKELFVLIKNLYPEMPFIAEDLGEIDNSVYSLRDEFNLPGMRILQFAFTADLPSSVHLPHNYTQNSVVYTGTHDNNTTKGWFKNELSHEKRKLLRLYAGVKPKPGNCHNILNRLAWSSNAGLAIIPMQDLLGLGSRSQMNRPATTKGNWVWRLKKIPVNKKFINKLKEKLYIYGRSEKIKGEQLKI